MTNKQAEQSHRANEAHIPSSEQHLDIANITLLYESRDGRMCLFEDSHGHLTAVRASKLA